MPFSLFIGCYVDIRVTRILSIIIERWNEPIRLRALAAEAHLSQSRIEHLFKEETGMSIREFLLRLRVNRAADLLLCTDLSIKELCAKARLRDHSTFCKLIRRYFKMTPQQYRQLGQRFFDPE